jgi:hypothetical protein
MLYYIRCHRLDVMCVIIAVHIVVYAVFIFACVAVACLDTTPYWVRCISVLSVCVEIMNAAQQNFNGYILMNFYYRTVNYF